jgi:rod shape-determining protein MreC
MMWRRTSRDRVAILLLGVATLTILTLDFRTHLLDRVSSGIAEVVGVFQTGVRTVARPVENVFTGLRELTSLRSQNAVLRQENQALRQQAETYSDLARQNSELRRLLEIEGGLDVATVRARVIGATLTGLERSVLIDKGRNWGIVEDTAVLDPEGLIGRISWVGSRTAKVLLLTDSQSSIGVKIATTGETGVVTGTGGPLMRLELISRAALDLGAVKRGDVVLTSGHEGGIFPPSIPIGRVEQVNLASRGTSYAILVRPFASLTRLDIVSVALRKDDTVAESPPVPTPEGSR